MSVCLSHNLVDVALVLKYLCKYIMVSQAITEVCTNVRDAGIGNYKILYLSVKAFFGGGPNQF